MTLPTIQVRISTGPEPDAFLLDDSVLGRLDDGGVLGDGYSLAWTDISDDVRLDPGVTINRGATNQQGPYFRTEAGSCSFTLDNRTGIYDPFNTGTATEPSDGVYGASTYGGATYGSTSGYITGTPYSVGGISLLRPGLPVSVQATYQGVTYDLFTGFVTSWLVDYPEYAIDSVARVTCHDGVGKLANAAAAESVDELGDGENAGTRIDRVLDNVAWYAGARDIDTDTVDAFLPTVLDARAWDEMQSVADDVNGYLWVTPDGTVKFQGKSKFPRRADFTVGTPTGSVPTRTIQVSNDPNQMYNVVKLGRDEGVQATVTDQTSVDLYGSYSFERSGMRVNTDQQVQASLDYILSQHKDHRLRVEGLTVALAAAHDDITWRRMLGLDLVRRVRASFTTTDGRTIEREGLVRGMQLQVRPPTWTWDVSTTAAPEALGTFTLNDASLGVLDTSLLAAF